MSEQFLVDPEPVYGSTELNALYINYTMGAVIDSVTAMPDTIARDRLFRASSLIWGMLERKDNAADVPQLVQEVTALGLDYVAGRSADTSDPSLAILAALPTDEIKEKEFDSYSLAAFNHTDPRKVKDTLLKITDNSEKPFLFLPMANSAVPISLLMWPTISEWFDAEMYQILFSRTKQYHREPRLAEDEVSYIESWVRRGAQLVVFEEDTETGQTMRDMMGYLMRKTGADPAHIHGLTTRYSRDGQHAILRRSYDGLAAKIID